MLPIYIAFLLLYALLLWFIIGARGKWWLKLALIVVVPTFTFFVWKGLNTFSGWPTSQEAPKASVYVYGYVIEPDPTQHLKGAVYVWLIPAKSASGTFDYKPKEGEPRAYKLRSSRQLEGQVQAANRAVANGQEVGFGKPGGGKKGHGKSGSQGRQGTRNDKGKYQVYQLPTVGPPRKGTP